MGTSQKEGMGGGVIRRGEERGAGLGAGGVQVAKE